MTNPTPNQQAALAALDLLNRTQETLGRCLALHPSRDADCVSELLGMHDCPAGRKVSRDLAALAAAAPVAEMQPAGLLATPLDKLMDAFITSEMRGGDKYYALIFKYQSHEGLFAAEDQLHEFAKANRAAPTLPHPAQALPEVVAWQVWWGLIDMQPHWPPFKTRIEAYAHASSIKSKTEVRPLYASPPMPQEAPLVEARDQPTKA